MQLYCIECGRSNCIAKVANSFKYYSSWGDCRYDHRITIKTMTLTEIQNLPTPETDAITDGIQMNMNMNDRIDLYKHARSLEQQLTAMKMVVEDQNKTIQRVWDEDECGWIIRTDSDYTWCVKCNGYALTKEKIIHEDYCTQGFLYEALTTYTTTLKSIEEMNNES